jgi:hypothetical protein
MKIIVLHAVQKPIQEKQIKRPGRQGKWVLLAQYYPKLL